MHCPHLRVNKLVTLLIAVGDLTLYFNGSTGYFNTNLILLLSMSQLYANTFKRKPYVLMKSKQGLVMY